MHPYFSVYLISAHPETAHRSSLHGTPHWVAPEVLYALPYTTAVDIWSFGATVIKMAEGRPCLHDVSERMAMDLIRQRLRPYLWDSQQVC